MQQYKIEQIRKSKVGGQQVGSQPQDIKVTHIETGLSATCGFYRSAHQNREIATAMVEAGLSLITKGE